MGEARQHQRAVTEARMAKLLAALRRVGNIREACRITGISRTATTKWRKNAANAGKWQAALAAYETQRIKGLAKPGGRPTRLNAKLQRELLDYVAGTRSVAAAARAIGMDETTVWTLARRDVAFATALSAAVNQGYGQIEAGLIHDCIHGIAPLADETRERVSDAIRARMVANGHNKAAAREAAASDEAERDRNEALAAHWVAGLRAAIAKFDAKYAGDMR